MVRFRQYTEDVRKFSEKNIYCIIVIICTIFFFEKILYKIPENQSE